MAAAEKLIIVIARDGIEVMCLSCLFLMISVLLAPGSVFCLGIGGLAS
jgi:hypothetical protein